MLFSGTSVVTGRAKAIVVNIGLQTEIGKIADKINNTKEELVEHIVSLEWQAFDAVQNQGGRADCQDDWGTFSIMRKSQYLVWPEELLVSFYSDFVQANKKNWNLITEKYARMMKSTNPKQYAALEANLPVISDERNQIQEEIIRIQVSWMEEFSKQYPKMSANARSIHTEEDSAFNTSYETYLRGELGTYSDKMLELYGRYIVAHAQNGCNVAQEIMWNTVQFYGYSSFEEAAQKVR